MPVTVKVRILNFFRLPFKLPLLEKWLRRRVNGKPATHFFGKLVPNSYQYSPGTFREITFGNVRLSVDISDYIGHYLYFGFKDDAQQSLFSLCHSQSFIVDVGANIGWTLLNMAKRAEEGRVLGFEPDPYNYSQCKKNLSLNSFSNASVLPKGLGTEQAEMTMQVRSVSNRGENRISTEGTVKVFVDRLDDISEIRSWPRLDLIKIDTEGYELKVLTGAKESLSKFKPTLFIEVDENNLRDQGDSAQALIRFLLEAGYAIVRASDNKPVDESYDFRNCHFDVIARA